MNFVVILAIALIVMVIIIGIFSSNAREGDKNLRSCEIRNGVCVDNGPCPGSGVNSDQASSTPIFGAKCYDDQGEVDKEAVCCLRKQAEEEQ